MEKKGKVGNEKVKKKKRKTLQKSYETCVNNFAISVIINLQYATTFVPHYVYDMYNSIS